MFLVHHLRILSVAVVLLLVGCADEENSVITPGEAYQPTQEEQQLKKKIDEQRGAMDDRGRR